MTITPHGFLTPIVRYPEKPPSDKSYARSVSVVPDDFAILRGRPRVPEIWCNAETLVIADGTHYSDRDAVQDVQEDAYVSFVPLEDYYDTVTGIWTPSRDESLSRYRMEGNISDKPFIDTIEYTIGKEQFASDAMVISETAFMDSNFNNDSDDSTNFTFAMAYNLREQTTAPMLTFGDDGWVNIGNKGLEASIQGHKFKVNLSYSLRSLTPAYLVLDIQEGKATLISGLATDKLSLGSTVISTTRAISYLFTLAGEMDIFSLDFWGDEAPTPNEIIARYSSALGAHKTVGAY